MDRPGPEAASETGDETSEPVGASSALRDRLLRVMDRKDHWAWPALTRPGLDKPQLLAHFRHEYQTYVRDFPVLLARVLGQGPPADARIALAENIFEEQTGGLSFGAPHPALFLEMMDGLGIPAEAIESPDPPLAPEAIEYRAWLDRVSARSPWIVAAAVLTIFVEGSINERAELSGRRVLPPVEEAIAAHPMVIHYGCPPSRMRLARAHRAVEGGHRADAWRIVLSHTPAEGALADEVAAAMEQSLALWLAYRNGVARVMGISKSDIAAP